MDLGLTISASLSILSSPTHYPLFIFLIIGLLCKRICVQIKDLRRKERVASLFKMNRLMIVSCFCLCPVSCLVLDIANSYFQATSNDPEDFAKKSEPMPSMSIEIGKFFRLLKSFKDKTLVNRILKTDDIPIYNVHRYRRIRGIPNWG